MPTTETTAPVSQVNPMTTSRLAAEARAAAPPWTPPLPQQKPKPPAVVAKLENAAAIRSQGQELTAQADSLTTAAGIVGQRISALETERTAIQLRLATIEETDLKAQREKARASIHDLFGKPSLTYTERQGLNEAALCLAWSPLLEKEVPAIKKNLQSRLEKIGAELAELEETK